MKKSWYWIAFVIGAPCAAMAQDTTQLHLPPQWTLQACIEYARQNNIQVRTERLNTRSAEEDLAEARASRLPDLVGSATQNFVHNNNTNLAVGGFQSQSNLSGNYGVSSSMILYNGGYITNDIKSKQLSVQLAGLAVSETENNITLSITQAFLNILLARENIKSLSDVLGTSQLQLQQGQQKFNAGALSKLQLVQLQAQVATDQYDVVNAQNMLRSDVVALKQLLQLPTSYDLTISAPDSVIVPGGETSLEQDQALAQSMRPEVKYDQINTLIARTELEKLRAATLPVVSVGGALSTGYTDNQSSKYFTQLNNNFYQSLGLNVSVPIFNRRVNRTNINKQKIVIEQSQLALQNTQLVLNQEVEQAYINLQNAQAQYVAAGAELDANKESYDITNQQMQLGAINLIQLQQEKTLYLQSLQAYLQAKYTAVLYDKILNFYAGTPVSF